MFDPFKDFETCGYLRNRYKEKDDRIVKQLEHAHFTANIDEAMKYLAEQQIIVATDFLAVHRIVFSDMYPWAGKDRSVLAPESHVSKGDICFARPSDAIRAVNEGLRLGQQQGQMVKHPGLVMGLFAYGHPFLDGNGRTMLLVHMELAHRAGFSIAWGKTNKTDYLSALGDEIRNPSGGFLDEYLLRFAEEKIERAGWSETIRAMDGLNGLDEDNKIDEMSSDDVAAEKYLQFEQKRGYSYGLNDTSPTGSRDNGVNRRRG